MTLLYEWLEQATEERGSNKALVYRDNYLSWRGLKHRVERRAQEFAAMGIGDGDWVGLMLGNVPDFVVLALALSKLGCTIVPIDPTTASREFELVMETVPLRALITRPRGSEGQPATPEPPVMPTPRGRRVPPPAPRRVEREETKKDGAESRRRLQGTLLMCSVYKKDKPDYPNNPLAVLFTSDSAGDPKGVFRTRENLIAEADKINKALGIDPDTTILAAVPLFHAYGWDFGFMSPMMAKATTYLEEELSAKRVTKILREQDVDVLPGTSTLYLGLSKTPTARPIKKKGTRFLAAGSLMDPLVADAFFDRWSVRIMSTYHATDTGLVSIDKGAKSPETVGKIVDGVEIRLTDAAAKKIPAGEKGVIWVKGDALSPQAIGPYEVPPTKAGRGVPVGGRDAKGWYRTGDLGRLDKTGKLTLEGREDDLVKVDGKRVALGEVEGCLESFPKVKEAKAMLISDPLGGPMVVAKVVTSSKCAAEDLIDHCAKNLAPYKVPRRIEFCDTLS